MDHHLPIRHDVLVLINETLIRSGLTSYGLESLLAGLLMSADEDFAELEKETPTACRRCHADLYIDGHEVFAALEGLDDADQDVRKVWACMADRHFGPCFTLSREHFHCVSLNKIKAVACDLDLAYRINDSIATHGNIKKINAHVLGGVPLVVRVLHAFKKKTTWRWVDGEWRMFDGE